MEDFVEEKREEKEEKEGKKQKEEKQNCFARICKLQKLIKEEASLSNLCKSFKYLL